MNEAIREIKRRNMDNLADYIKELYKKPILKDLFLIEHILRTGNPRFADDLRDEEYKLKNLFNFSYYDESRSDKGETSKFLKL